MHVGHLSLMALMSWVMPGQYIDDLARVVIPLIPWWAAWRASRHVGRRERGMTILSPIQITSYTMLRSLSTVKYDWMEAGSEGRSVGVPSSMQNMRSCREGSEEVATWSCSGIDEIAEHRASWRLSSTEMADTGWQGSHGWGWRCRLGDAAVVVTWLRMGGARGRRW